jgi:hypothetical protein
MSTYKNLGMVHFLQIVLYKFLHGGTRRIHGERLLLLQNLRDSSVPSVFILKICKRPFILIEPCQNYTSHHKGSWAERQLSADGLPGFRVPGEIVVDAGGPVGFFVAAFVEEPVVGDAGRCHIFV